MSGIEFAYQNALMANAAYIDLGGLYDKDGWIIPDKQSRDRFKKIGFTDQQFEEFVKKYRVKDQVLESSGFSGTIFVDNAPGNLGKQTVAFRGTESTSLADLLADLRLALGVSTIAEKVADLFTPTLIQNFLKDEGYDGAAELVGIFGDFSQLQHQREFLIKNGILLPDGTENPEVDKVNITGHSLGGNLALQATDKYAGIVENTTTFNGAGVQLFDKWFFSDLTNLNANSITNYFATAGWEVTAGQSGADNGPLPSAFYREGSRQPLYIESQGSSWQLGNHSMVHLVNSLSVMRLLEAADPSVELASANQYLHAA